MRFRRAAAQPEVPPDKSPSVLAFYAHEAPSSQLAVDIFEGEWSGALPPEVGATAGAMFLYSDPRINFFIERAGGVDGRTVLELGPLEAGHTYMLERAGANVTAIEANSHAFLKCLIVKELVPLTRARFLFGDFLPYLETTTERVDLLVASGVLYHAPDPVRLLRAMARVSDSIGLWTHHFDPATMSGNQFFDRLFDPPHVVDVAGRQCTMHRRNYLESLEFAGFCGGPEDSAVWMELDDILAVLGEAGFDDVEVSYNDLAHPYGACALFHAKRLTMAR